MSAPHSVSQQPVSGTAVVPGVHRYGLKSSVEGPSPSSAPVACPDAFRPRASPRTGNAASLVVRIGVLVAPVSVWSAPVGDSAGPDVGSVGLSTPQATASMSA